MVADYPMEYNSTNRVLTMWGNDTDTDYDFMGYNTGTSFDFDDVKDYALYIQKTVTSAAIVAGGTGYAVDDVLTVSGGTGTACQLKVTSVSSGVITGVDVENIGEYTVQPTNPVSVTGGTGNDDATFDLTFPTTCRDDGYEFDFAIRIEQRVGSSSATWFEDINKLVTINRAGLAFTTRTIYTAPNTYFYLGMIEDSVNRVTHSGCDIMVTGTGQYNSGIMIAGEGIVASSTFRCPNQTGTFTSLADWSVSAKLWNSTVEGAPIRGFKATTEVYDCIIANTGVYPLYYTNGDFDNVELSTADSVANIRHAGLSSYGKNLTIKNIPALFRVHTDTNAVPVVDFTNTTIDNEAVWTSKTGVINTGTIVKVYRRYEVDLYINDEDTDPIENAQVVIKNQSGNTVADELTDVDGNIDTSTLLVHYWEWDDTNTISLDTNHNPFTITVSKSGYETYTSEFDILEKQHLTITLQPVVKVRKTIEGEFLRAIKPELGSSAKLLKL